MGNRWDEFSPEEHSQLATLAYNMLQQGELVGQPEADIAAVHWWQAVHVYGSKRKWQASCRRLCRRVPSRLALPAQACLQPLTCCLPLACDFVASAGATSWAIRSKASLLLALVIKRTGPELWEAALPQLLQAAQTEGPPMQEQVGVGELLRYVAGLLGGCKAQVALQAAVWSIAGCDEQSLLPSKAVIAGQHCPWGCHPACHLPVQVCMVMRYVADEIAMYSDDIAVRTCC